MVEAVELVRERLLRATAALDKAGVPYAVAGGNAVAAWVSRIDRSAARTTQDVDILLRRDDFDRASNALSGAGFVHAKILGVKVFLDGPNAKGRDAVHILFAGEKVRPDYATAAPEVLESEKDATFQVLGLEPLVRMKLTSYRRKDQVHLQDLIGVGLIDATWPARFSPPLDARLRELIADPEG
ncbi:MAG TPA: hypothetical protein VHX65_18315 [Pirellulales bacterium]|jgi:hypothetical protein|nr:hypothetical protein [Pirellulales bacterium]